LSPPPRGGNEARQRQLLGLNPATGRAGIGIF